MPIQSYLNILNKKFKSGIATEHAYRTDFENLFRQMVKGVEITNEPSNVTDCGNPDYVITKGKIPIGYIEAKDIDKNLNSKQYKEQFNRYKKALDNLIITDYIWFQFFQNGELVHEIKIGEISGNALKAIPENFAQFEILIGNFCAFIGQTIKAPKKLAEMMASKARLLQNILEIAITSDEKNEGNTTLKDQYNAFRSVLIHELKPREFADIYAQTLAYGMFAARLHDESLDTFSRQEVSELIPKTNPFLRKLFQGVAGYDIDDRIRPTVDNLADVFRATDVDGLLHNFGQATQTNDPIIHFYETFLAEYDPKLRKSRGVWYTPEPVVNFIVRAVDDILKTEFGLPKGLADTSKTTIKVKTQTRDKRTKSGYKEIEREVHRVQILDPATGTGTFLAEVVKHIYNNNFKAMKGAWSGYVEEHLIPRLNGFELLMASYAMAHLKLDMLLTETGFKPKKEQRFNIYLTNSLEEYHPDTGTLFSSWLSTEANEANYIKRDTPVMCVIGNPPYSGESANKGEWIMSLMEDYKKEPGGEQKLKERNPKWINDDYVKFLRYGQYLIEKNGSGVLAFINPHGFLDNPTFRGMRWHLLKTYDKIYTIDLHGNNKKKETAPDGSDDVNVFDIMQGVSINLFIKTGKKEKSELGKVFHYDLFGKRELKYDFLIKYSIKTILFNDLPNERPNYYFVNKTFEEQKSYNIGFSVYELFIVNGIGLTTAHDDFVIKENKLELLDFYKNFQASPRDAEYLHKEFNVRKKTGWNILKGYDNIKNENDLAKYIQPISYRPFDNRYVFYEDKLVWRTVRKVMQHFINGDNIALMLCRQIAISNWEHVGITNQIVDDSRLSNRSKERGYVMPLYLYPETNGQLTLGQTTERTPNFNAEIVNQIAENLGLNFTNEKATSSAISVTPAYFAPIDILDYIYAVLHSPTYREKYKEFLKIDFPRIPYPENAEVFWQLVKLGGELRQIHLLESPKVAEYITQYPKDGDNTVTRKLTKTSPGFELTDPDNHTGNVWINDKQYFDSVPIVAWEFFIGGYQPAQKWLKDRKGRQLDFEDISHYQKIIVALTETDRIMKEIDEIEIG